MITITGIRDHDETETAITFDWNLRSRSTGTRTHGSRPLGLGSIVDDVVGPERLGASQFFVIR